MGRPKGSKNKPKSTETKPLITKMEYMKKRAEGVKFPKHVLLLEYPFYITCDKHTFVLKAVNDKVDADGNKCADTCLLYSPYLDIILQLASNYMIRIPADAQELSSKLKDIYDMLMVRTEHKRPKDLFKDFSTEDDISWEDV